MERSDGELSGWTTGAFRESENQPLHQFGGDEDCVGDSESG